jgi:alpha-1,3-rhamnosyl/mannosyltransferase
VVRNLHWGIRSSLSGIDVLFIPHLLGAEVLFLVPSHLPTTTVIHDIGGIDCIADRDEATGLTNIRYRLSLAAACRSTHVITVSQFVQKRSEYYCPCFQGNISAVYEGFDPKHFFPRDQQQSRAAIRAQGIPVADDDYLLMYVGAEYRRKNLPTLIAALAHIKPHLPRARLLKVGASHNDVDRQRTLKSIQQHELQVGRDVLFIEQNVDDGLLGQLYAAADVFVSASTYEGFGLPLLEALACGRPAVVNRAGALPEVGGNAALYVDPPYAADALANRVLDLATGQLHISPTKSLTQADKFSWQHAAALTTEIFRTIINQ